MTRKTAFPAMLSALLLLSGCANSYGTGGSGLGGLLGGILGGSGSVNDRALSDFERAAVNACGQEAERTTRDRVRVDRVDQVSRDTVRVDGRIETRDQSRDQFTCTFASNGRIADFRLL
ncbi:hypothetical protein [Aurantiacibacter poecillastricola]|uniref:hypothetical protein n=1 Tax=Aurantiacibacter poecillastricola TaxID=3064385 RepID=UPI00273F0BE4|nr:hypothetical protein [Aurantiacibacter sp. 219JJ12-13]MDP5260847.1 hypothetical protein [Aurantiacibacter sp. 219JJ12-13]